MSNSRGIVKYSYPLNDRLEPIKNYGNEDMQQQGRCLWYKGFCVLKSQFIEKKILSIRKSVTQSGKLLLS